MVEQFQRRYRLIVGHNAVRIEDLDIEFEVIRTLSEEPNTCEITVYGLKEKTRQSIIDADTPPVSLWAGYEDKIGLIFLGDARDCYSEQVNTENLTHINSGDSEFKFRTARINKTFKAGTSVVTVLKELVKVMGIQPGNIGTKLSSLTLTEGSAQYVNGTTISGKASKELSRVVRSCGHTYSIQNNSLQLLSPREALQEEPIILVKENLVGSPEIGSDGTTRFTCLLDPDIKPGKLISLKGKVLRAERCKYTGEIDSQDWYTEVEGRYK